jgi:transcriptional regulator with XRE-family HTH domain
MDIREVFALNLRRARNAKGLSQEALAHEADVDRTYVSALERSKYSATIDMVDKLAKALGVDASALLQRPTRSRQRRPSALL